MPNITSETLRRDRDRREKDRRQIARKYDAAAEALEMLDSYEHRDVIDHLRREAEGWRTR